MSEYKKELLDHFMNPRNVGEIAGADGVGAAGDPACGDFIKVWLKVEGVNIADIKYKCRGCPSAIAAASAMSEIAIGMNIDAASELTDETIAEAIGGLSPDKMHCSNLAAAALYEAIMNWALKM